MTGTPLGPGQEFDRIRAIARTLGPGAGGLGDDCAVVPEGDGPLLVSTDASVEQVHFRLDWIGLREVGWRAGAAALSDLAAMGAVPAGLVAAVVAPSGAGPAETVELMAGVADAGEAAGAPVLGGDLSSGPVWMVAVTVLGRTVRPVRRAGAQAGDGVWVTGRLGGSRAALEAWRRGASPLPEARAAFSRPAPRIAAGRWLAAHGAHAMLDLSDGLAGDAGHLAAASAVALEIDLDTVPVAPAAAAEAQRLGMPPAVFAAEGGEDYELLVALPPDFGEREAAGMLDSCGAPLTRIGRVAAGEGVRFRSGGRALALRGFDHFR